MPRKPIVAAACAIVMAAMVAGHAQRLKPVTIDDLMALRTIVDVEIAPDGNRIAYAVSAPSIAKNEHQAEIFVVSATGGTPARVAADARVFTPALPAPRLRWSPDGATLSFLGVAADRPQVFGVPASGGPARAITAAPEGVFNYEWAPDGRGLAYVTRDPMSADEERQRQDRSFVTRVGAPERATRLWVQALEPRPEPARVLTPPAQYVDSFSWSPNSQEIVYSASSTTGFTSPYYTRLYTVSVSAGTPRACMASAGFGVLFPMPRGGSGYGEAGHRAIVGAWGESDYKDIMAGVDHLIARGIADPDRLGVMGASYGGFMTNWIVTQTSRFKAASAGASMSDLTDLYYLPDGGDLLIDYFKRPWEAPDSYARHSPLTYAQRVTTPLLLQHGERDPRVPIASAQKFYRALKALGKTVEFEIYPRGGHVLTEPVLEREQMRRNLEWFTRWIKPGTR